MSDTRLLPTRQAYEAWAEDYDRDENATRDLDAARLRAAPPPLAGAHVVEIGAGTGKNTVFYAEHAARVTAMDVSTAMLAQARKKLGDATVAFIEHDVRERWPVKSGGADGVAAHLVLEHIQDLASIFAEAARVLKPGGWLYLSEFHPFRQLRGGRARFEDGSGRSEVEAYVHLHADFLKAGLAAGFRLEDIGEWLEDRPDAETTPPRLLTLRFSKPRP
jgi:ubiquinone/menaquinone biosynthesis C-methylase UbiE